MSTTITFFIWSNWKAALTANSSQDAELEHAPWARVHPRSFGRVQMGFPNATNVMSVGSRRFQVDQKKENYKQISFLREICVEFSVFFLFVIIRQRKVHPTPEHFALRANDHITI